MSFLFFVYWPVLLLLLYGMFLENQQIEPENIIFDVTICLLWPVLLAWVAVELLGSYLVGIYVGLGSRRGW